MSTIWVDVVSAEESIYEGEAEFIVLPGVQGELGIYPRHAPLITNIKPGLVRLIVPGKKREEIVYVNGGVLEVQPDRVTVLADTAVRAADLDQAKAEEAKKLAEEALLNQASDIDYASAQAGLASAVAQLSAIKRLHKF